MIITTAQRIALPEAYWLRETLNRDLGASVGFAGLDPTFSFDLVAYFDTKAGKGELTLLKDRSQVDLDGDWNTQFAIAAWFRSVLPSDFPRIVLFDEDSTGHVDLVAGCTAESLQASWQDDGTYDWAKGLA